MIVCAWCGAECDGSIGYIKEITITYFGPGDYTKIQIPRGFDRKMFCSEQCRTNWFVEP